MKIKMLKKNKEKNKPLEVGKKSHVALGSQVADPCDKPMQFVAKTMQLFACGINVQLLPMFPAFWAP